MSTACTQNLAPMVTQAMRSVAKTAGRCWAIPNWRPASAASLLRILAPVTGRGDMIVLLRPYGGHGWQCAGLRVYGTVGDNTGVEADAGAATAGAVWTVLPVKTAQAAAASATTAGAPLDGGGGGAGAYAPASTEGAAWMGMTDAAWQEHGPRPTGGPEARQRRGRSPATLGFSGPSGIIGGAKLTWPLFF